MKKLFFTICFMTLLISLPAYTAVIKMKDEMSFQRYNANKNMQIKPNITPDDIPVDYDEFIEYIQERAKKVDKMPMSIIQQNSSMSTIDDVSYISNQKKEKSTFEKIYESAINRLKNIEQESPQDRINTPALISEEIKQQETAQTQQDTYKKQNDINVINVTLPTGKTILAPAKEHIPYLSSKIEILPNGMIHITETVNLIANGQKLKYGLNKALPKYSISRDGIKNTIIPYLNSVRINGTEVPHYIKDDGDLYLITPKDQFKLASGVYTYEFDYMLDRKLWYYKDRNEFYWDVTGSFWNLAISQAIATIRLPVDIKPLGQNMLIGYIPNLLTDKYSTIIQNLKTNALGFTATRPLLAGEGMHILVSIPKKGFIEPDFNKKFEWFIEDYGDIIFSLIGLLTITIAYIISWRYINSNASPIKIDFPKTPAMLRVLAFGKFDKICFASFLLDLFRRNIIDLKAQDEETITLIKKTDNLARLNKYERKAFYQILKAKETSININRYNAVKLKRAYKFIEKDTINRLKRLSLKLNFGYILFSCAMLFFSEAAIALLNINPITTIGLLISSTITLAFYIWILRHHFEHRWINRIAKVFALFMIVFCFFFFNRYIHAISTLIILVIIWNIFSYTSLFTKRNGLIKNNIHDAIQFGNYLKNNAQAIIIGGEFRIQQANIYALDASSQYSRTDKIVQDYRLDLMPIVLKLL